MRSTANIPLAGLVLLIAAHLNACVDLTARTAHDRGAVTSSETILHFDRASIDAANRDIALTGPAECDVSIVQLTYRSEGVEHEPAELSAGLFIPEHCTGPFPVLAEAHGTETDRRRLTTQVDAGNNTIAFFAAHGFLVVATDYLGLGKSNYAYHPYLHADSESSAIIDSIRAARNAAHALRIPLSGQVMLFGYSQGGHAAMAAQREIDRRHRSEFNLVATAPMAGPYYLSQTFINSWFGRTAGEENGLAAELFSYTVVNYNHIYRNIYTDPQQIFAPPYAEVETHLFPATQGLFEIRQRNLLPPGGQLNELRNPAFTAAFLLDARQPFRVDLERNDLLDWTPATPMLLCGSRRDAIVDFNNAYAAQAAFRARGVEVPVVDVADEIPAGVNGMEHHTRYAVAPCYAAARSRLFDPMRGGKSAGLAQQMPH